jgi:large subunit ribosomal protein L22
MEVRAIAKYIRVSPRKARLVMDLVRGKDVGVAKGILRNTPNKAARLIEKVLDSAVANAENNHEMAVEEMFVTKGFIDEGPTLKRFRPRSMGSASRIRKRTSHITIVVSEREG